MSRPSVSSVLFAALAAFAAPCVASAETIALTGATVHTVSGPVLENATVVIAGGKIAAVGAGVTPPADARVVDARGKHVYPGFVSAQSVLGLTEIGSVRGTNDFSEMGNLNPNIKAEVAINPESDLIPVARANGVTSVLVVPQGGSLAGTSALIHLDGWTYEDMTVASPVALHIRWPSMTINRAWWETRPEDEQKKARDEALATIKDAFDDARAYWKARGAEGRSGIPRHDRDVKWDAMGRALRGEIPVLIHANALNQIRAALRFATDEKLPRVVLVGAADAWRVADELKARDIAVVCGPTLDMPERRYDPYDAAFTLPAQLAAAGVRYCISDGGDPFGAMNARNLPYHAAMAAAFGLSRDDALKSVTLYPAQILGVADRVGSIETGRSADLFVSDGDPLEITTHVEQVYIAGRPVAMENRQTHLFQKYDGKPRGTHARKQEQAGAPAESGSH